MLVLVWSLVMSCREPCCHSFSLLRVSTMLQTSFLEIDNFGVRVLSVDSCLGAVVG